MADFVGVGEAARRLGARPADITQLFYHRELDDTTCPIVGGKRIIPLDYLPTILSMLKRRGRRIDHPYQATPHA